MMKQKLMIILPSIILPFLRLCVFALTFLDLAGFQGGEGGAL